MRRRIMLLLIAAMARDVAAITWDFQTDGDTQGWVGVQSDGRRLRQEVHGGVWRVLTPARDTDDPPAWSGSHVKLISPRISHDSAMFDQVRMRFRVVSNVAFEGYINLSWRNQVWRPDHHGAPYYVRESGLVLTGDWQEVEFAGLVDGADCGHKMYTPGGTEVPCYLEWEGALQDIAILVTAAGRSSEIPGAAVDIADALEVDWIQLTGFEEQLEGQLAPPTWKRERQPGRLLDAAQYSPLGVPQPGATDFFDRQEALGDVNRDGSVDVVALWRDLADLSTGWFVAFGDGQGKYSQVDNRGVVATASVCRMHGGDLDGDGDLDVALSVGTEPTELRINDEERGWMRVLLAAMSAPQARLLGLVDADGDGDVDPWFAMDNGDVCAVTDHQPESPELRCWRPDGISAGARAGRLVHGLGPRRITGALWGERAHAGVLRYVVAYQDAEGEVVEAPLGPADHMRLQAVADLDADGGVDMLMHQAVVFGRGGQYHGLHMLLNQGDGTWHEIDWQPEAQLRCGATLGDLNGDGLIDIVWADDNLYDPGLMVALGQAGGLPRIEGRYPLKEGAGGPVLLGDVNNDGHADVVVVEQHGYQGNGVHVLLNRGTATAVTDDPQVAAAPARLRLGRNHPNPFNAETVIPIDVPPDAGVVALQVYDILGRPVRQLVHRLLQPGRHALPWDGRDEAGNAVAAGVYLYRLETRLGVRSGKMVKGD